MRGRRIRHNARARREPCDPDGTSWPQRTRRGELLPRGEVLVDDPFRPSKVFEGHGPAGQDVHWRQKVAELVLGWRMESVASRSLAGVIL